MAASPPVCDFGWKAPDFELPATDGGRYSLSDVRGPNGLVVAFICNHCPFVLAVVDRIVRDARELRDHGIGFAAICSNDAEAYPEDNIDRMAEMAREKGFPFPYLHDEDQSVARAWGAACTPDFFGLNADLELQYRGRLDASRQDVGRDDLPRELFDAMVQVARTGKGPADQVPSMGCSIKWKAA
jgi:peroxiredoxin